jgi:hypothetical protein
VYSVTIKKDVSMTRNITLSADEKVIKEARMRAQEEHSSLNVVFRDWLYRYAAGHRKKSIILLEWNVFHMLIPEGNSAGKR